MLGGIVHEAEARAAQLREREAALRTAAHAAPAAPSLHQGLRGTSVAIIAEVKRRSPSKGTINSGLSAGQQALAYASGGASAISILTEPVHFGGSGEDLEDARSRVAIPILKKDFHVHPVQLLEAKALGASGVLLIARALSPRMLATMASAARDLGLDALVEIRSEEELERALAIDARIIGVNNRDLETLEIDIETSARLIPLIPSDRLAVAESGVRNAADIHRAASVGADAVLVGSTLSASVDPAAAVRALAAIPRCGRAH